MYMSITGKTKIKIFVYPYIIVVLAHHIAGNIKIQICKT